MNDDLHVFQNFLFNTDDNDENANDDNDKDTVRDDNNIDLHKDFPRLGSSLQKVTSSKHIL